MLKRRLIFTTPPKALANYPRRLLLRVIWFKFKSIYRSHQLVNGEEENLCKEIVILLTHYWLPHIDLQDALSSGESQIDVPLVNPADIPTYLRRKYPSVSGGMTRLSDDDTVAEIIVSIRTPDDEYTDYDSVLEALFSSRNNEKIRESVDWDWLSQNILQNHSKAFCENPESFLRRGLIGADDALVGFSGEQLIGFSGIFGESYDRKYEDVEGNPIEPSKIWYSRLPEGVRREAESLGMGVFYVNIGGEPTHVGYEENLADPNDRIGRTPTTAYYDLEGNFLFEMAFAEYFEVEQHSVGRPRDFVFAASSHMLVDGLYFSLSDIDGIKHEELTSLQLRACEVD